MLRVSRFLPVLLLLAAVPAQAEIDVMRIEARLAKLTEQKGVGILGVGIRSLDSGKTVLLEGDRKFPQQSVYKIPIAIALLDEVDRGRIDLARKVQVQQAQLAPGYSPMVKEMGPAGLELTIGDLLRRMISVSDNSACDVLLDVLGGPAVVQRILTEKQLHGVRVDRPEKVFQMEWSGLGAWQPDLLKDGAMKAALAAVPDEQRRAAMNAYLVDPRDTATPRGMVELLSKLADGKLLSPASTELLLRLMRESEPGAARLKAGLPQDWTLAHKPGTSGEVLGIAPVTNDVGLVTTGSGERIAIVALLSASKLDLAGREAVLASVGRALAEATAK